MKFLAREKEIESVNWKNTDSILKEEAIHISELYLKGIVREIYFDENNCAVILMECDEKNCAKKTLNNFPLVKAGLITFDVTELKPYTGFSRLINDQKQ